MSDYKRVSVLINQETANILRTAKKDRGISTTEALGRAIGLLGFFHETQRSQVKVCIEDQHGKRSQVEMI